MSSIKGWCLATVIASGCGGGGGGSSAGSVDGTVHGAPFAIADVVSGVLSITDMSGGTLHEAAIWMSSTPNACSDLAANIAHPNQQFVVIGLATINGATADAPTAPGAFTIVPSTTIAYWTASSLDGTCRAPNALVAKGTGGTVELTGANSEAYAGTFDVQLDSGEHVTGDFDSTACAAVATTLSETNHVTPTCQ